jgi:2-polyprenyl-3-methyl-5-hydroxy-6-metoxy-1,4-benzoquinol methylase
MAWGRLDKPRIGCFTRSHKLVSSSLDIGRKSQIGVVGRPQGARLARPLTIYEGVNECVFSFVPSSAVRILDIGCGTGAMGERLRLARERFVAGITYSEEEARLAQPRLSRVICGDLNDFDFSTLGTFDCVILSHILEHLYSPDNLLERLKGVLAPEGVIVVALPNVVWWKQRLEFLFGRWRYRDWGILDRTHFRFFDRRSAQELVENAGYEILMTKCDGPFPGLRLLRKLSASLARKIDDIACYLTPGLFSLQFVYLARVRK